MTATLRPDQSPSDSPPAKPSPSADVHRRETWRHILLPVAGGGLVIVFLVSLALLLPLRAQVALVADLLLTVFVLCPLAVCLFPVYIVMVVAAFGMNKVHTRAARPMRRMEALSRTLADNAIHASDTIGRTSVGFFSKFAVFDRLWGMFDRPETVQEGKHESTDKE